MLGYGNYTDLNFSKAIPFSNLGIAHIYSKNKFVLHRATFPVIPHIKVYKEDPVPMTEVASSYHAKTLIKGRLEIEEWFHGDLIAFSNDKLDNLLHINYNIDNITKRHDISDLLDFLEADKRYLKIRNILGDDYILLAKWFHTDYKKIYPHSPPLIGIAIYDRLIHKYFSNSLRDAKLDKMDIARVPFIIGAGLITLEEIEDVMLTSKSRFHPDHPVAGLYITKSGANFITSNAKILHYDYDIMTLEVSDETE